MVKLEDYTITELKKMISSFNKIIKFSAYSKMKKAELINMLRHHKRIIVEEGSNGVKIMIDTEEDFKKQTKVKKEKVKKEVKKEVEKLDDVKVDVKTSNEKPEEEPKKKFKFKVKAKKEEPKAKNPLTNDEKNKIESLVDYMDKGFKIKGSDFSSGKDLEETITQLKYSRDKLKRNGILEKALERFEKGKTKQEPKKLNIVASPKQLFNKEEKELNEKTLNMILKADVVILLKPADVALDTRLRKMVQRLYNKLFKVYEKSYGDLLDKYNISKSNYSEKAVRIFNGLIKEARKEKEKSAVDTIVELKEAMSPIFDKKFNPKSVVDRIDSMKDIDDINKEITIVQKKVKEVSGKSKSSGKETEAEKKQLQNLQEKYTKRLKSIVNSMKKGASFL